MSIIAVTGASGPLGRQVIEGLLERVPASRLVAVAREPGKVADLAARGVTVRRGDYDEPASLRQAFAGVERLLFVSGNAVGQRVPQHRAVVDAARAAGVRLVAYTSIPRGERSPLALAVEHAATERMIREADLPFVFLRNNWYFENYTARAAQLVEHGVIGSAGEGRIAGAARADFAAAAAAVIAGGDAHAGKVYELGGDRAFTLAELAAELAKHSGREVTYTDLPRDVYEEALVSHGVPVAMAAALADADEGIRRGALGDVTGELSRLIGRPTTTLAEAVASGLATAGAR